MKKILLISVFAGSLVALVIRTSAIVAKGQPPVQSAVSLRMAFHDAMRKLWEDHIIWTRQVIVDVFATTPPSPGLPDLPFAVDRLLNVNQTEIGNAIKPYYGNVAGDQLTGLLKVHISEAATILNDLKTSSAQLNDDIAAWYVNANAIASFLNGLNSKNWPLVEAQDLMKMHLDKTTDEVLARFQQRWADDVAAFDAVHVEILEMADFLSDGIIDQFPQKFTQGSDK